MTHPTHLRDAALTRVNASADDITKAAIDAVIARANASGLPWSTNDVRDKFPTCDHHLIGARVRAAATRRPVEMTHTGRYVASTLPSTHAHEIKVWVGVGAEQVGQVAS